MSTRQLKVALFGAGKMGAHHARAIQAHGRSTLVAVYDPLADAESVRRLSPRAKTFADPHTLLNEVRPDLVHVCTPPASHVHLSRLAIEQGASVYVEKPFSETSAEASELLALAAKRGVSICAGHQYLFEEPAKLIRENLAKIGKIIHIESYFSFRKVRRNLSFVEQTIDILPHPTYLLVDILRQAAGESPVEIDGIQASVGGEVRALMRAGDATGVLVVSLQGRPVDHYLKVIGTNGCLIGDFVRGSFTSLDGPGAGFIPLLTTPFRQARQMRRGARHGLWNRFAGGGASYPGLTTLVRNFHESVLSGAPSPTDSAGIAATVKVCENVASRLRECESRRCVEDQAALTEAERTLAPLRSGAGVLVTGATGFLGRRVVHDLRGAGWRVRAVGRTVPAPSNREPGVEYVAADLGVAVPRDILDGMGAVVHCAASSEGGKAAHERGTIAATRNIAEAAAMASIRRFVHISSLAVLKPGSTQRGPLNEETPLDKDNLDRGPYVWAKAEAEEIVREYAVANRLDVRIIRPGPIVDFGSFDPPGRLGRDLGSHFVAVGPKKSRLSVVDVGTVATVILAYLDRFDRAPALINLVEPDAPMRKDLLRRTIASRPWLRPIWIPGWMIKVGSPIAVIAQRLLLKSDNPISLAAAFSNERYDSAVARDVLRDIGQPLAGTN